MQSERGEGVAEEWESRVYLLRSWRLVCTEQDLNSLPSKKLARAAFALLEDLLFRLHLTAPGSLRETSSLKLDTARWPVDGKSPDGGGIARAHLGTTLDSS
jgi:hypothetical protein